jgi:hypothetical protein
VRKSGKGEISEQQKIDLMDRRRKLEKKLDQFEVLSEGFLVARSPERETRYRLDDRWDDIDDRPHDSENPNAETVSPNSNSNPPEDRRPLLPSALGWEECVRLGLRSQAQAELLLRTAQLDDLLKVLRDRVGERSLLYETEIRSRGNYYQTTRSWKTVHGVTESLRQTAECYSIAWAAFMDLNPTESQKERYRELKRGDLKNINGAMDPSLRGQRNSTLSWIWAIIMEPGAGSEERSRDFSLDSESRQVIIAECLIHDCKSSEVELPQNKVFA